MMGSQKCSCGYKLAGVNPVSHDELLLVEHVRDLSLRVISNSDDLCKTTEELDHRETIDQLCSDMQSCFSTPENETIYRENGCMPTQEEQMKHDCSKAQELMNKMQTISQENKEAKRQSIKWKFPISDYRSIDYVKPEFKSDKSPPKGILLTRSSGNKQNELNEMATQKPSLVSCPKRLGQLVTIDEMQESSIIKIVDHTLVEKQVVLLVIFSDCDHKYSVTLSDITNHHPKMVKDYFEEVALDKNRPQRWIKACENPEASKLLLGLGIPAPECLPNTAKTISVDRMKDYNLKVSNVVEHNVSDNPATILVEFEDTKVQQKVTFEDLYKYAPSLMRSYLEKSCKVGYKRRRIDENNYATFWATKALRHKSQYQTV